MIAVGLDRAEGAHPVMGNDRQCRITSAVFFLIIFGEHAVVEAGASRTLLFVQIFTKYAVHKLIAHLPADRDFLNQLVVRETLEALQKFQTIHVL